MRAPCAETIGVNRSTARGIVSRYVREGRIAERPRGGSNHVRVDNAMRDCLDDIINENYLLTIAEMNRELRLRLPHKPVIHVRAEARRQGLALGNYRPQLLLQALQRNIGTITVAKCGQWFRFMQTYLPRCINNEAIEG